jgi:hypothetical protein
LRTHLAPLGEWLEYADVIIRREAKALRLGERVSSLVQRRIQDLTYKSMAPALRWPARPTVEEALDAVEPYLRTDLHGEAVLTVGGPLEEWRRGRIDAVVSVGPLECMPNKISEAQLFHVAEREGLLALTLPVNGDPVDAEVLDNFAFETHARFQRGRSRPREPHMASPQISKSPSAADLGNRALDCPNRRGWARGPLTQLPPPFALRPSTPQDSRCSSCSTPLRPEPGESDCSASVCPPSLSRRTPITVQEN